MSSSSSPSSSAKQLVLVTGGNRGIGKEVCRQLADLGDDFQVLLACRDVRKGQDALNDLGNPATVRPIQLDVTSETSIAHAKAVIEKEYGGVLDVLVNNAGINFDAHQTPSMADLEYVQETLDTNLLGPWKCTQGFLPLLQKSKNARIVNVSSGSGSITDMMSSSSTSTGGTTPAYSISKAALNALTVQFAKEFPSMRINAVCPGWVATDMGGPHAPAPVEQGGCSVMWAILLDQSGPTGGNFLHGKPVPW
jgi:NAD(P)-dependent dehydrogenase (short-subunit alcohol dehydrogenase family)